MWTKICGTTNLEDAQLAADLGADAVGFVLAPSKRQVTPQQVAEITPHLPVAVEKIGVFVTQEADEILAAVTLAGLTGVQLHSAFNPVLIERLRNTTDGRVRILQVVDFDVDGSVDAEKRFEQTLHDVLSDSRVDAVLLDTAKGGISGGTGVAFNWERAAEILRRVWPRDSRCQLIVAGGLKPENVAEAIAQLLPDGVDVVSGVEAYPGKKDSARVQAFLEEARL